MSSKSDDHPPDSAPPGLTPDDATDLARVQRVWDQSARDRASHTIQGWLDSPIVARTYVDPKVSGAPGVPWLVAAVDRLRIPKNGRWLSLGCGIAEQEVAAGRAGVFASLLALDASDVSLGQARAAAAAAGLSNIEFDTADFNRLELAAESFDVIVMNMSLHHVRELRTVLTQIRRALKRRGYFLVNEYIGPSQFQFTDLQLRIVRELLELLPPRYRRQRTTGDVKQECVRLPVDHWNRTDPSEAIFSRRIVPEIERQFRIVERIDYGGTILHLLLEQIVQNFDAEDERDVAIVRTLAKTEDLLIRGGVLTSDFAAMAMRKRARPMSLLVRSWRRFLPRTERDEDAEDAIAPGSVEASVDFRKRPHAAEILRGFHQWDGSGRWIGRRADLALQMISDRTTFVLTVPLGALRRRRPDWVSLEVRVRLEEPGTGRVADLQPIVIDRDGPFEYFRQVPEPFASVVRGRAVRVVLECDRTWVPAEVLEGADDVRELSVFVLQAGFAAPRNDAG